MCRFESDAPYQVWFSMRRWDDPIGPGRWPTDEMIHEESMRKLKEDLEAMPREKRLEFMYLGIKMMQEMPTSLSEQLKNRY